MRPEPLGLGLAVPRSIPLCFFPVCCIAFGTLCVVSGLALGAALPIGFSLVFSKTFASWVGTGGRVGACVGRGGSVGTGGRVGTCVGRGGSVGTGGRVGTCVGRGGSVGTGGRVGTCVGRGGSVGTDGRVGTCVGRGGSISTSCRVGTRVGRGGSIGTQMTGGIWGELGLLGCVLGPG